MITFGWRSHPSLFLVGKWLNDLSKELIMDGQYKFDRSQQPKRKPADLFFKFIVGLNIFMVLVAIGIVAMLSSVDKANAKADRPSFLNNLISSPRTVQNAGAVKDAALMAAPRSAGGGTTQDATATATTVATLAPTATFMPGVTPVPGEPIPAGQGGTCIQGTIIDVYHQQTGAGWPITARLDSPNSTVLTTNADANGFFKFPDPATSGPLPAGVYRVELAPQVGWSAFTPNSFLVTLNGNGPTCAEVRFKMEAKPCLVVTKLDKSGNLSSPDKIGIPGWGMTVKKDTTSLNGITDGKGRATFYNLLPGTWTVQEESKIGWKPAGGETDTKTIELVSPKVPLTCQTLTFINEQVHTSNLAVKKQDSAGQPLAGWDFTVTRKDGTHAPLVGTTGANGFAFFPNLPVGEWIVTEKTQTGWKPLTPATQTINLAQPSDKYTVVTFTNMALGCIDGYKINHLEQGLSGWKITAKNASTGDSQTATTDVNGYFKLPDLTLGTWIVSEELQPGWDAVTPTQFDIQVTTPFSCETVRFKNKSKYACLDVYKKDTFDNAGLPGWVMTLQPAFGGQPITGVTDGTGWLRFNQLTPGDYVLSETMQGGWAPAGPTSTQLSLDNTGTCSTFTFYNYQTNMVKPTAVPSSSESGGGIIAPTPTQTGNTTCSAYYTVKSGDTLYNIALSYNVSLQSLRVVNNLTNTNIIHPNNVLCIPRVDP